MSGIPFVQKWFAWLVGKKIMTETGTIDLVSKTKLVAVIGILMTAVPQLAVALGHPIPPNILEFIQKVLAYGGLWCLRDAIPSK